MSVTNVKHQGRTHLGMLTILRTLRLGGFVGGNTDDQEGWVVRKFRGMLYSPATQTFGSGIYYVILKVIENIKAENSGTVVAQISVRI